MWRGVMNTMMFGGSPDAVIGISTRGLVEYWGRGAQRTFGYGSEETLGRNLTELIVPEDRIKETQLVLRECVLSGSRAHESMFRHKDGSSVYADLILKAICAGSSEIVLLVTTKKDLTHQRLVREARLLENRFRDVVESVPDAIAMVNEFGSVILNNARAEHLFGYHHGALLGKPMAQLLPERYRSGYSEQQGAFFHQPCVRTLGADMDLHGLRADGVEFLLEINLCPLHVDTDIVMMCALHDVTQLRKGEYQFHHLLQAGNVLDSVTMEKRPALEVEFSDCRRLIDTVVGSLRHLEQTRGQDRPVRAIDAEMFAAQIEAYLRPELRAVRQVKDS